MTSYTPASICTHHDDGCLITPDRAAELLGVHPKTVSVYADRGSLFVTRTVGGHRRYCETEVRQLKLELEDGS